MMRITTSFLVFSLSLAGCAGDDSGTATDTSTSTSTSTSTTEATTEGTTDDSTSSTTSTTSTTDPTTSTTASETTSSTTDDSTTGVTEQSCDSFCTIYLDACADFKEFDNQASCVAQCEQWPLGAPADTANDSLGCRIYHATVAKTDDPVVHCPHAGKNGGGVCIDQGAPDCANYCTVYFGNCKDDNNVYADDAACLSACGAWYQGSEADVAGDTIGCRTYHATAALGDPALHCPHASPGGGGVCVLP